MNNILSPIYLMPARRMALVQLLELQAAALERLLALSSQSRRRIRIVAESEVRFDATVCRRSRAGVPVNSPRRTCRKNLLSMLAPNSPVTRSN